MHEALIASGRPILFSICEWGTASPYLWAKSSGGNLWRTTGDVDDKFQGNDDYRFGMMDIVDLNADSTPLRAAATGTIRTCCR